MTPSLSRTDVLLSAISAWGTSLNIVYLYSAFVSTPFYVHSHVAILPILGKAKKSISKTPLTPTFWN